MDSRYKTLDNAVAAAWAKGPDPWTEQTLHEARTGERDTGKAALMGVPDGVIMALAENVAVIWSTEEDTSEMTIDRALQHGWHLYWYATWGYTALIAVNEVWPVLEPDDIYPAAEEEARRFVTEYGG